MRSSEHLHKHLIVDIFKLLSTEGHAQGGGSSDSGQTISTQDTSISSSIGDGERAYGVNLDAIKVPAFDSGIPSASISGELVWKTFKMLYF